MRENSITANIKERAMDPKKEKPTVETVQPGLKVSDLLMVAVCQALKERLDQIDVCR